MGPRTRTGVCGPDGRVAQVFNLCSLRAATVMKRTTLFIRAAPVRKRTPSRGVHPARCSYRPILDSLLSLRGLPWPGRGNLRPRTYECGTAFPTGALTCGKVQRSRRAGTDSATKGPIGFESGSFFEGHFSVIPFAARSYQEIHRVRLVMALSPNRHEGTEAIRHIGARSGRGIYPHPNNLTGARWEDERGAIAPLTERWHAAHCFPFHRLQSAPRSIPMP